MFNSFGVVLTQRRPDSAPGCGNARNRVSRETMVPIGNALASMLACWNATDAG